MRQHSLLKDITDGILFRVYYQTGHYHFVYHVNLDKEKSIYSVRDLTTIDPRIVAALTYAAQRKRDPYLTANDLSCAVHLWSAPQQVHFESNQWIRWEALSDDIDGNRLCLHRTCVAGVNDFGYPVVESPAQLRTLSKNKTQFEALYPGITLALQTAQALGLNEFETATYCHQQHYHQQVNCCATLPDDLLDTTC